jgi:hypothetical protein
MTGRLAGPDQRKRHAMRMVLAAIGGAHSLTRDSRIR